MGERRRGLQYSRLQKSSPCLVQPSLTVQRDSVYFHVYCNSEHLSFLFFKCVCVCLRAQASHTACPCCHGDVAGTETVVAGWGRAQWGAELRLTVTVTLERGE